MDVVGGAVKQIAAISAIRDEATGVHELSESVDGGESAHRREVHDADSVGDGEVIVYRDQRIDLTQHGGFERTLEVPRPVHVETLELNARCRGDHLRFLYNQVAVDIP